MRRLLVLLLSALLLATAWAVPALALPAAPSSRFRSAGECGCHGMLVSQWSESMHRKALSDPIYQYKLEEGDKATNGALGPFCNACHGPVAVMSGQIDGTDQSKLSTVSAEAITCDFCHQITGTAHPPGNTSQTLKLDETKRAQYRDSKSPAHASAYSKFSTSAEFCGACHDVNHPVNGMHLESTYSEWKASPYAEAGIVCQDCHMTPNTGAMKPAPGRAAAQGPVRPDVFYMTWVGGNAALGNKFLAEARLRSAAGIDILMPEQPVAGSEQTVSVRVSNLAAGHMLPTGLTEVRQMWIELVGRDWSGKQLFSERHDFGTVLQDAKGNHPVELWAASSIYSDDRIQPKGFRDVGFRVRMPEAQGQLTATLFYRSASPELAAKAGVKVPTTMMASITRSGSGVEQPEALSVSATAAAATAGGSAGQLGLYVLIALAIVIGIVIWGMFGGVGEKHPPDPRAR